MQGCIKFLIPPSLLGWGEDYFKTTCEAFQEEEVKREGKVRKLG